jgi:hypothetical protein
MVTEPTATRTDTPATGTELKLHEQSHELQEHIHAHRLQAQILQLKEFIHQLHEHQLPNRASATGIDPLAKSTDTQALGTD